MIHTAGKKMSQKLFDFGSLVCYGERRERIAVTFLKPTILYHSPQEKEPASSADLTGEETTFLRLQLSEFSVSWLG